VLWFCWNFELMKFCQHFANFRRNLLQNFGTISSPSPLPKKPREKCYLLHCANFHVCQISIIPLEMLSSADLNYFIDGMFNCVQVIWLGLCDTNRIYNAYAKFRQNFTHPLVIFFDETFTRKFRKSCTLSCQNFPETFARNLDESFVAATLVTHYVQTYIYGRFHDYSRHMTFWALYCHCKLQISLTTTGSFSILEYN